MKLPFLEPENDIYYNLGVLLLLIKILCKTTRGTLKLNNSRLQTYLFLVNNPVKLNDFLNLLGKKNAVLSDFDYYSVKSISPNIEPLFDRDGLKYLVSVLVSKSYIDLEYKKGNGFFYTLTEVGNDQVSLLSSEKFSEIELLCNRLKSTLSISDSEINKTLNIIIKRDSYNA
ncbi:hypothetical protein F0224_17605 [Vibrio coralliilyticus]|uniref:ABC-three component system middle component 4 n=1 Tax=Vibrio coralliilyticus TaxID=190893 RepID=UPI000BAC1FC7|nr:ABC-three component system middle component 4 [Vibrio coralliilyticus]NOI77503.1 hypothetical protein [Vibrio coralliilyticus]PAW02548.1 hypothetical protein CKJ79_15105 [Vibrio coralliilyticus]